MASCPTCGEEIVGEARFCPKCGTTLLKDAFHERSKKERTLQKFGPFGVSIAFARPGIFVWAQRNNTEIVVTNQRIYGRRTSPILLRFFETPGGDLRFEVPLNAIIRVERADFLLNKAVYIRYQTAESVKEVSIIGAVGLHAAIAELGEYLKTLNIPLQE